MNCKDIVVALRAYRGRSYRALFNAAADTIEALEADLKYTERCELCDLCVHAQHTPPCADPDGSIQIGACATCAHDCLCKNCRNFELFEWRGVQKRNEKKQGGQNSGE